MPDARVLALLSRSAAADAGGPPDADLLARFLDHRDPQALDALVRRHAGMVRAVCRAALANPADADDAFQATFLVLVRRADAIRDRHAVGGWLYRVAYRVARKLRRSAAGPGVLPDDLPGRESPPESLTERGDVRRAVAEEIERLPENYRLVVQLCYVAGRTTAEAADVLGWSKGTVLTRLAWARKRLRTRLERCGVTLATGSFAVLLGGRSGSAVPPELVRTTVETAWAVFAAGGLAAGVASERTLSLTEGVVRAMAWNNVKLVAGVLVVAAAAVGVGAGTWGTSLAADPKPRAGAKAEPPAPAAAPARPAPTPAAPIPDFGVPSGAIPPASLPTSPEPLRALEPVIQVPEVRLAAAEPPRPAVKPGKTFQVESPVGGWTREVAIASGQSAQVSLQLEGDRLTLVILESGPGDAGRLVIEADYSINKESLLFGVVTSVDAQVPEGSKPMPDGHHLPLEEGQLFSFRFRVDGETLTVKDVRFPGPNDATAEMAEVLSGRFATRQDVATLTTDKAMRSVPRRRAPVPVDTLPLEAPAPTPGTAPPPRIEPKKK